VAALLLPFNLAATPPTVTKHNQQETSIAILLSNRDIPLSSMIAIEAQQHKLSPAP
jgi:hypothetical protein